jgi:hypothetical protein
LILKQIELNKTKMKKALILILATFTISATYAQVGINADNSAPHSSAQLDVKSTTKAFYPPRMTTGQKNAIMSPQVGAVVYDITLNQLSIYNGSAWVASNTPFSLPYVGVFNTGLGGGYVFDISNSTGSDGSAIVGRNNTQISGEGILGVATATAPLAGVAGVYGRTASTNANGIGVKAFHAGTGSAFYGNTTDGIGATLLSTNGFALKTQGKLQFAGNGVGILGLNKFLRSIDAAGNAEWADLYPMNDTKNINNNLLYLTNSNTTTLLPVIAGVTNSSAASSGLLGIANNTTSVSNNAGVRGVNKSTNDFGFGVFGIHEGTGAGVVGQSLGNAVMGFAQGSGIGGYFTSSTGAALVTGQGKVGIGINTPASKLDIQGSTNLSHFYYGTNEDTYIRGGKATSNVIIGDVGNNIGIKTAFPFYDLTFKSELGDKISFWGGETSTTTNHYGIGMQGGQLQFFVPTNSDNLVFGTGRSESFIERMRINGGGNVGIGTNNPLNKLQVNTTGNSSGIVHQNNVGISVGTYIGFNAGWYGTFSNHPLSFFVNNGNPAVTITTSEQLQVGGTATPAGFKMSVDGKLICTELEVKVTPWADYVFDKNYKLKPLEEVESFIEKNHHLPNIPKAKDIENQSLALGNMAKLQMEKIEELTLYVIEINKRLQKIEQENETLKAQLNNQKTK